MADDMGDDRGQDAGAQVDMAPLIMDDVIHKLHALDYTKHYCAAKDIQPFSRVYFAIPAQNVAVQYQHFMGLCVWLLQQARRPFTVDRYEDPATSINRLVGEIRGMGLEIDFPPLKLRQAHGEPVCRVLAFLCDCALAAKGFQWQLPNIVDDPDGGDADVEEDEGLDEAEEEAADAGSGRRAGSGHDNADDEDEEVLFNEQRAAAAAAAANSSKGFKQAPRGGAEGKSQEDDDDISAGANLGVMQSSVDPIAWRAEVERVAPRLKGPAAGLGGVGTGGLGAKGEWRGHLDQTKTAEGTISKYLPASKDSLERLSGDLAELLEMVSIREKSINTSMKHLASDYQQSAEKQSELKQQLQSAQSRVTALSNELATVSEALDDIKGQMDERGSSMTDTSPLIRIKASLSSLRGEVKAMDLQLGVVGHAVMQYRISHKNIDAGTAQSSLGDDYAAGGDDDGGE